ncbi:unnamed protein product [Cuscuta europaea]|uniref:Hemimethylated DNA-binding domain-containing protein n=1 Tax=Cuscuta europaea TaxID=41803 RepID=A0A9P0ZWQ1_CUSEU|nr:unnamed protein product [Cuscuta europaea]
MVQGTYTSTLATSRCFGFCGPTCVSRRFFGHCSEGPKVFGVGSQSGWHSYGKRTINVRHTDISHGRNWRVEAGWLFKGDMQDSASTERSESANEDILMFFFQLDLATRVQCALNMEQYDIAQQLRNKLTEVESAIIKEQESRRGSASEGEVQDLAISILRLRADQQNAVQSENYSLAADIRDRISKIEAESLAASVRAQTYGNDYYAFRLGQRVKHKVFGYCGVICGMDPVCCESSSWMENAKIDKLSRGSDQPFYQVLVDVSADPNLLVTYVPEENLDAPIESNTNRFDHPYISLLFYGMDAAGDFIPIKELREKYKMPRHEVPYDQEDENTGEDA